MYVILLILAFLLLSVFMIPAILFQIVFDWHNMNFYFKRMAIALDQLGNVLASAMLNTFLIKKEGYKFGNPDETISSSLGKNKEKKTLTFLGKAIAFILNLIDAKHVEKSIEEDEK